MYKLHLFNSLVNAFLSPEIIEFIHYSPTFCDFELEYHNENFEYGFTCRCRKCYAEAKTYKLMVSGRLKRIYYERYVSKPSSRELLLEVAEYCGRQLSHTIIYEVFMKYFDLDVDELFTIADPGLITLLQNQFIELFQCHIPRDKLVAGLYGDPITTDGNSSFDLVNDTLFMDVVKKYPFKVFKRFEIDRNLRCFIG